MVSGLQEHSIPSSKWDNVAYMIGETSGKACQRELKPRIRNLDMYRCECFLSRVGHVKSGLNSGGPPSKTKEYVRSIANKYHEGKVKRTPGGE